MLIIVTIILCSTLVPISANEMSYDDPPFAVTFSPNSFAWAYVDYTDFKMHIEFEAKVKHHESAISFNAAGSYHHSNVTYNIQPTLTLTDKAGSVAITISENTEVNPTIAE